MDKFELKGNLIILNEELRKRGIRGEIFIYGGAVMCLEFGTRDYTEDIDAIFEPKGEINEIIESMVDKYGLEDGWLNDGVKGFLSENNQMVLYEDMSNLSIYFPTAEYMFAMKALSCRTENIAEMEDIRELVNHLNIKSIEEAESIVYDYYPSNRILPKTFYTLEEVING